MDEPVVSQPNVQSVPSPTTAEMSPMRHREGITQACDVSEEGAAAGVVPCH